MSYLENIYKDLRKKLRQDQWEKNFNIKLDEKNNTISIKKIAKKDLFYPEKLIKSINNLKKNKKFIISGKYKTKNKLVPNHIYKIKRLIYDLETNLCTNYQLSEQYIDAAEFNFKKTKKEALELFNRNKNNWKMITALKLPFDINYAKNNKIKLTKREKQSCFNAFVGSLDLHRQPAKIRFLKMFYKNKIPLKKNYLELIKDFKLKNIKDKIYSKLVTELDIKISLKKLPKPIEEFAIVRRIVINWHRRPAISDEFNLDIDNKKYKIKIFLGENRTYGSDSPLDFIKKLQKQYKNLNFKGQIKTYPKYHFDEKIRTLDNALCEGIENSLNYRGARLYKPTYKNWFNDNKKMWENHTKLKYPLTLNYAKDVKLKKKDYKHCPGLEHFFPNIMKKLKNIKKDSKKYKLLKISKPLFDKTIKFDIEITPKKKNKPKQKIKIEMPKQVVRVQKADIKKMEYKPKKRKKILNINQASDKFKIPIKFLQDLIFLFEKIETAIEWKYRTKRNILYKTSLGNYTRHDNEMNILSLRDEWKKLTNTKIIGKQYFNKILKKEVNRTSKDHYNQSFKRMMSIYPNSILIYYKKYLTGTHKPKFKVLKSKKVVRVQKADIKKMEYMPKKEDKSKITDKQMYILLKKLKKDKQIKRLQIKSNKKEYILLFTSKNKDTLKKYKINKYKHKINKFQICFDNKQGKEELLFDIIETLINIMRKALKISIQYKKSSSTKIYNEFKKYVNSWEKLTKLKFPFNIDYAKRKKYTIDMLNNDIDIDLMDRFNYKFISFNPDGSSKPNIKALNPNWKEIKNIYKSKIIHTCYKFIVKIPY